MARLLSDQPSDHPGERDTLDWLVNALPDDYGLFAGLEWAAVHGGGGAYFGEIDFAVVAPSGTLLLIEQKNGGLRVDDGQLVKQYGRTVKAVGPQLRRAVTAVQQQWQKQQSAALKLDYLLYLPDYRVHELAALQLDPERLVDGPHSADLVRRIETLGAGAPNPEQQARVEIFLAGALGLQLDIGAALQHQERRYLNASQELWRLIAGLDCRPWRVAIHGCAGSGKTQLAYRLAQASLAAGQRPLYLCFNRPLADAVAPWLPAPALATTVDRLSEQYMTGHAPIDHSNLNGLFPRLRKKAMARPQRPDWLFDTLVIDEGQDFSAEQLAFAERFLKPGGRLLWLADPRQALYARDDRADFAATVTLQLDGNYRSPRRVVECINAELQPPQPERAASALAGEAPVWETVTAAGLAERVEHHIRRCLADGYRAGDIAVLSLRGLGRASLRDRQQLAGLPLRRFTGRYSADGQQAYSEGLLLHDSIHRFKGLQAGAVILYDAETDRHDAAYRQRLYVGLTRARGRVVVLANA